MNNVTLMDNVATSLSMILKAFILQTPELLVKRAMLVPAYEEMVPGLWSVLIQSPMVEFPGNYLELFITKLYTFCPPQRRQNLTGILLAQTMEQYQFLLDRYNINTILLTTP